MRSRNETSLVVRPGRKDDAPACAAIEAACFTPSEVASFEKIQRRAEVFPQGFLVAELGREVVGFISRPPGPSGTRLLRPLLTGFIAQARPQNRSRILLLCKDHMVPYYLHFGFEDAGPSASTHGGYHWREMRFML
ncbi:MAG: hypothetical protein SGI92_10120 [Bryobacteraceae bacterium]|nr:hypothetical protein [Bryobacteraceae bacterium]